ncbi:MAG: UvrD-helicase domain-containing protein [Burkholderiaceae bacterium]
MSSLSMNAAQRQAVTYLDGPCLVIAGAGSGKTRVITGKVVHLVRAGVAARHIAAITFTNKAAQEMAERLTPMLAGQAGGGGSPLVCTFHSLGVRMLRQDGQLLGLKRNFSILDSDDAAGIIQQALATTDRKRIRAVVSQISLWKNALLDPDRIADAADDDESRLLASVYREYTATLRAYQAVDFDDLIGLPLNLLREHPEALTRWRETLRYLLVDEYQDTNACQYALLRELVGPRAAFTLVGDDDQSIYGWRGATLENLQRVAEDYPALKVIKLEQNYRSVQTILHAANTLIARNPKLHPKTLYSELGVGDPVTVTPCDDDVAEAESVVMRLQGLKFERRSKFSDFAILYRGNYQARIVEKALREQRIPYRISGGQSFFEKAEIRDLIAYLRLLANEDDDPAFIRAITTPKRGVGSSTLAALGTYAGQRHLSMYAAMFETGMDARTPARPLAEMRRFGEFLNRLSHRSRNEPAAQLLDEMVAAIDYQAHLYGSFDDKQATVRWQNVCEFLEWVKKRANDDGASLLEVAQSVALITQLERREDDTDAVRMTTIHASKGLEFPHVFLIGCEEGMLPHHGGLPAADDGETQGDDVGPPDAAAEALRDARIEEERRLMYVAVTRAQRSLHLSWCRKRRRARRDYAVQPSRFIEEMALEARPQAAVTITGEKARNRLGALKAMIAAKNGAAD